MTQHNHFTQEEAEALAAQFGIHAHESRLFGVGDVHALCEAAAEKALTAVPQPSAEPKEWLEAWESAPAIGSQNVKPVAWIDQKHLDWLAESPDNLTGAGLSARQRSANMVPLYTHAPDDTAPATDVALLRQCVSALEGAITYDWHGNPSEDHDRECAALVAALRERLEGKA